MLYPLSYEGGILKLPGPPSRKARRARSRGRDSYRTNGAYVRTRAVKTRRKSSGYAITS